MEVRLLSLLFIYLSINPVLAQNKFGQLPHDYSSFINNSNISWAVENFTVHSFKDSAKSINIQSYLVTAQKTGLVKCYLTKEYEHETLKKWARGKIGEYFTEIDHKYNDLFEFTKNYLDSNNLHEIFYIKNHVLKSHIIAAAPLYQVVTSNGIYLGNTVTSYSSLNFFPTKQKNKSDEIYSLGNTQTILNIDSIEETSSLKKTYRMSLPFVLWYDLAKGHNQIIDLKTKAIIPPDRVMEYSPFDSIETFICIDSITLLRQMIPAAPAYSYFSDVEIEQDWYYNKSKDIFFNKLNKVYWSQHGS